MGKIKRRAMLIASPGTAGEAPKPKHPKNTLEGKFQRLLKGKKK